MHMHPLGLCPNADLTGQVWDGDCISNRAGMLLPLAPDHVLNDKNLDSESPEGSGLYSIHFGVLGT